ncbi:sigma E protease regulator RseP [Paraglaciecola aestuariivivens]
MSILINLVSFIVALGILVAVHEWGHFWVARRCGVKVQRFSIGFGKALWSRTDKLGTEYVIAAIPLGGYVKMLDERVDEADEQDLPQAFNRQPVLKRIAIIAAGPGVNFLFAIFALFVMYSIGVDTIKPVVGKVEAESIFSQANLPEQATLTQIGERRVVDWEDVAYELMAHIGNQHMQVKWQNPNTQYEKTAILDISNWQFDPDKSSVFASLGLTPYRPEILPVLGFVEKDSAADKLGLQANDKILRFDGTSMQDWEQIVGYVTARPNQEVQVEVLRNEQVISLDGQIGSKEVAGQIKGYMGFVPTFAAWPESMLLVHKYGVLSATSKAIDKTWRLMTLSVQMLGKLFTGDVSVKNLSGPIAIAQGAGTSASSGLVYFLGFLALISVNLGIINLLPLPVLDGGHLLYYFIELFSGRPVPESVQQVGFKIGGVVLLLLMSIAIVNDIARL